MPTKSDRQQKCKKLVRIGDCRSALPNTNPMGATLVTLNFQAGFPLGLATCQMLKGHMWLVAILQDSAAFASGGEHLKTGEGVSHLWGTVAIIPTKRERETNVLVFKKKRKSRCSREVFQC